MIAPSEPPAQTRVADIVARRLHVAGCRHAFGIPGGEVLVVVDALERAGIRFVLTKHENCAGFMAEGAHHADGAPGILVATVGPGVANAVNVVANALQDQVPLIVISGRVDDCDALTYTHQVFDHRAVLGPLVKASFAVPAGGAEVVIDKALAIACDDPPGPVHLDIPITLAGAEEPRRDYPHRARSIPGAASGPEFERARAMLAAAERPLLIAGVGVLHHGASDVVADFARDLGVPLLTTYKAKGVLPESHPMALGGQGLSPLGDRLIMPLIKDADLIVLAGYDPIEMRAGWRDPWEPDKAIEFVGVPNTHYMHHVRHSFVGDIGAGLLALREAVVEKRTYWPGAEPRRVREELKLAFAGPEGWGPHAVFRTAREVAPPETVITADSGAHRILLSQSWECHVPRGMLQSSALCTMGCALPLAVGHKLAKPEAPVIAFVGDAGLEMVLGELATLRDLDVPLVVIVLVDGSLTLIEMKQRGAQLPKTGVDFGRTDFAAVAEAIGGSGRTVRSEDGLKAELGAALQRDGFTVIACEIPQGAYDGAF